MNERALRVLEFNKIRELVKKYAVTKGGKELVENLVPYESVYDIKNALEETNEAYNLIVKKGNPPFEGLRDIREAIERARKGGSLTTGQLLYVGNMLRCTNNVKEYLSRKEEEESFDRLFKNLMNYKTLRGTVIWESKYLEEKDMPFTDDMDPELVSVYRQMLDDENARRRPLKSDVLTHIDSMRDEDNNIDFDQVYGQYDVDDIYSRNRSDLQVLGFLPKENSDDVKGPRK